MPLLHRWFTSLLQPVDSLFLYFSGLYLVVQSWNIQLPMSCWLGLCFSVLLTGIFTSQLHLGLWVWPEPYLTHCRAPHWHLTLSWLLCGIQRYENSFWLKKRFLNTSWMSGNALYFDREISETWSQLLESHIISWEKKIKLVHDTWLVKEWPKNIAHTQFYIIVEFASERPNYTHAFSVLDTPKFMKLAYSVFLREFVEMFYCFLRFFAFIFVPLPQLTFMKEFQISIHVLERMKPFFERVITITNRRKKTSMKCLLNSLSIGFIELNNFKKCHGTLNYILPL